MDVLKGKSLALGLGISVIHVVCTHTQSMRCETAPNGSFHAEGCKEEQTRKNRVSAFNAMTT